MVVADSHSFRSCVQSTGPGHVTQSYRLDSLFVWIHWSTRLTVATAAAAAAAAATPEPENPEGTEGGLGISKRGGTSGGHRPRVTLYTLHSHRWSDYLSGEMSVLFDAGVDSGLMLVCLLRAGNPSVSAVQSNGTGQWAGRSRCNGPYIMASLVGIIQCCSG